MKNSKFYLQAKIEPPAMFPVADIIPAAMLGPPQQTAVAEIPAQPKPRRASTRPKTNGKHPPMIAPNINPIHPELNILNFLQESEITVFNLN